MGTRQITVPLSGRIDSGNAAATERQILEQLGPGEEVSPVLDAEKLEYISSAGLRVILHLKKRNPGLRITNVSSQVYEILEMTGFTEMMPVEKAWKVVSVEGCEVIGEGFKGRVYRIDRDTVVKTYKHADALEEIRHEREVARLALILGVPTAISYDVVRVGDSYGSVFELLNARSFAKILAEEPERMDWCVKEYVDLLKKVHSIVVPRGKLPSGKEQALIFVRRVKECLPEGYGDKLERMVQEIPESDHMIHGDYHTKNIVLSGDEVLLIDMDTLAVGDPIFELEQMYNSYLGFSAYNPQIVKDFQGFDRETAEAFWKKSLRAYLNTEDEGKAEAAEERIRCISYADLIDWKRRYSDLADEEDRETLALWTRELIRLLDKVDSLDLRPFMEERAGGDELEVEASGGNLARVQAFVEECLKTAGCSLKTQMHIGVAVEEIFMNIAEYAYAPGKGSAIVRVVVSGSPAAAVITFIDRGTPYDPLARTDPDVTLPAEEREIGGLGVFMTKKLMDDVVYEYRDGQNILTLKKHL